MPRKRPIKKISIYGKFELNPDTGLNTFLESKRQNKYYTKKPSWDVAREGLELTSLQHERDYLDFKIQQKQMRNYAQIHDKYNKKRIFGVYKMQQSLREDFISVNDFIQDSESKRTQAEKAIQSQHVIQDAIKKEIQEIEHNSKDLNDFNDVLTNTVENYKPYEEVIENVVSESDVFKSVKELIERCDGLMIAEVEISEMNIEKVKEIEKVRQDLLEATNQYALIMMGLKNELTDLEAAYEYAKNTTMRWEKFLTFIKSCICTQNMEATRLIELIRQLYKLLAERNGEDVLLRPNKFDEMLQYIRKEILILKDVVRVSKIRILREQKNVNESSKNK